MILLLTLNNFNKLRSEASLLPKDPNLIRYNLAVSFRLRNFINTTQLLKKVVVKIRNYTSQ